MSACSHEKTSWQAGCSPVPSVRGAGVAALGTAEHPLGEVAEGLAPPAELGYGVFGVNHKKGIGVCLH